jgi:hypothetical protein
MLSSSAPLQAGAAAAAGKKAGTTEYVAQVGMVARIGRSQRRRREWGEKLEKPLELFASCDPATPPFTHLFPPSSFLAQVTFTPFSFA